MNVLAILTAIAVALGVCAPTGTDGPQAPPTAPPTGSIILPPHHSLRVGGACATDPHADMDAKLSVTRTDGTPLNRPTESDQGWAIVTVWTVPNSRGQVSFDGKQWGNSTDSVMAVRATCHAKPKHKHCTEDMPCWDWTKMGNRTRGVILKTGDREVMGVCQFWQAHLRGDFKLSAQRHLKGDGYALKHGCE